MYTYIHTWDTYIHIYIYTYLGQRHRPQRRANDYEHAPFAPLCCAAAWNHFSACVCVQKYVCVLYICMCVYECIFLRVYVCRSMCVCVYICICVYMDAYMYPKPYTHAHTSPFPGRRQGPGRERHQQTKP